ncbi:DUF4297 domain-containing protein [Streptomyces koelreuteriae]|uniref:DUF4297 domain-containing protein n=1 Tax=Streptomyces koelreuteriae TaxID=2838015 RepID=A0ABX8FWY3_9ACTN|nr:MULTISPECIES: dsDNA nuclease domain-containing protein [Streptomyces]QWB25497.1 DUF4297 domain-containing protein [Streptomyces koelreuteriae]UUA08541.1 DUF4297 domain-containing protein [Streptomyces koelreuteriae]UUA16146.1 DUF4297 domain-containing protein [Streptomyces sp. CRCS-T-1]
MHEPIEDSGSDTADRYRYQYQVIARHCCEFDNSELLWALCEWHTDYILALSGHRFILVSVKHRERSKGNWTLTSLCDDGGLNTLRARWEECRKPDQVRLATNGALDRRAKQLAKACATGDAKLLKDFSEELQVKLGCATPHDAFEFLMRLRVEAELAPRKHIRAINIESHVRPMLRRQGKRNLEAGRVYDSIVQVVEEASRSVADNREDVTWTLSRFNSLDHDTLREEDIARRLITAEHVAKAVDRVPKFDNPLLQTHLTPNGQTETRLAKKLRQGGIGETGIQSARRTRRSWTTFAAQYRSPLPLEGDLVDDLTTRVLHEAAMAEAESFSPNATYGREMLRILHDRLTPNSIGAPSEIDLDRLHLLGLAYQLTDECKIWWSPEFDLSDDEEEVA